MELSPRLIASGHVDRPTAVVLVLHGGGARRGSMMVSPTQLSVLRMIPIARALANAGSGELAVVRLLNSVRGWDARRTPVDDVGWALRQVRERFGDTPVGLVGHSLGGRAALLATAVESVTGVVALNPFLYPQDASTMAGHCRILVVQGTADRISRPDRTVEVVTGLQRHADVRLAMVTDGRHAMLRRHRTYTRLASAFTAHVMLGRPLSNPYRILTEPSQVLTV